jgi:apolipoprotein D and lipocalin family protein
VVPKGKPVVTSFEKEKYLGKWYEIARLDFKFERGLSNTTAQYTLNDDGSLRVENRGYNAEKGVWKRAVGKAKFVGAASVARLKVSFFGPFYGAYNVLAVDPEYRYALVAGSGLKYLWLLSRETTLPEEVKVHYLRMATDLGYDTSQLLWVSHNAVK